ncbi:MAG TPA: hypothetical protein VGQ83_15450 [Polyangia bacterium]
MSVKLLSSMLAVGMLVTAGAARADIPRQINFQGRLASAANDSPISDTIRIKFSIYNTAAPNTGTPCLEEETTSVTVTGGLFNVNIGAHTTGGVSRLTDGGVITGCDFASPYWLELSVDGETMNPRVPLTAAPYALRADVANRALKADVATQAGSITSATGVPGAWGKIGEVVLTSNTEINLTFPPYDNLRVEFSLATADPNAQWMFVQFNGDATATYWSTTNCIWSNWSYNNPTAAPVTFGSFGVAPPGSTNRWAVGEGYIGNRVGEIKQFTSRSAYHHPGVSACNNLGSVQWANTASRISSIRVWSNTTANLKAGSRLTVYGR